MSNRWRLAIAVGFVVVAVAGFILLQNSGEDENASATTTTSVTTGAGANTTTPATLSVTGTTDEVATFALSVPAGGPTSIERLDATEGQRVVITVELAEAGEVHVHGYDLMDETGPGEPPARFDFVADDPGIFEIEVEDTATEFAELRVTP